MKCHITKADAIGFFRRQKFNSFALTIGSPPYAEKGQRYAGEARKWATADWVEWMVAVTTAAVDATCGPVLWVVNGAVKNGCYMPACEGLVWEYWKQNRCDVERPCIWHKNAPPNRKDWFGNDWEFILAFGKAKVWNWEAIAAPPKFKAGGRFRQRNAKGERRLGNEYPSHLKLARPRDVFRVTVGGGHLGSKLAHDSEAPFPEKLVEPFILALTNPGDTVCDPFSGSGTTAAVAVRLGRHFVGCDNRQSQVDLSLRRVAEERSAMRARA